MNFFFGLLVRSMERQCHSHEGVELLHVTATAGFDLVRWMFARIVFSRFSALGVVLLIVRDEYYCAIQFGLRLCNLHFFAYIMSKSERMQAADSSILFRICSALKDLSETRVMQFMYFLSSPGHRLLTSASCRLCLKERKSSALSVMRIGETAIVIVPLRSGNVQDEPRNESLNGPSETGDEHDDTARQTALMLHQLQVHVWERYTCYAMPKLTSSCCLFCTRLVVSLTSVRHVLPNMKEHFSDLPLSYFALPLVFMIVDFVEVLIMSLVLKYQAIDRNALLLKAQNKFGNSSVLQMLTGLYVIFACCPFFLQIRRLFYE